MYIYIYNNDRQNSPIDVRARDTVSDFNGPISIYIYIIYTRVKINGIQISFCRFAVPTLDNATTPKRYTVYIYQKKYKIYYYVCTVDSQDN